MSVRARRIVALALAALVLVVDQAIKRALIDHASSAPIELLPIFRLAYTQNYGISLGLLTATSDEMRWLLLLVTTLIAIGVLVWLLRERRLGDLLALALVLGGALGNIADRARRGFVVDYADLHFGGFRPFLIFNLADAAISIGVVILLARSLFSREERAPSPPRAGEAVPET